MFGRSKRIQPPLPNSEFVALQPHGEIFPWPRGMALTALDDVVVLEIPLELFGNDKKIGECLFGPDDMEINSRPGFDRFFIRLKPGMTVSLAKSVQARVISDDGKPRRIKAKLPPWDVRKES